MIYTIAEDVANRGLQHIGATRITSFADNSKNAAEASFAYDKCRLAELRSNLWNFSARRVILRPFIPGVTQVWIGQTWNITTTYQVGNVAAFNGLNWISILPGPNLNVPPGLGTEIVTWQDLGNSTLVNPYVPGTTYYAGEMTTSNGGLYITSAQTTVAPTLPPPSLPTAQAPWVNVPNTPIHNVFFFALLGATTNSLATPKTVYPLPNNYLRVMPQDPKTKATPAQLTTAGMQTSDFEFEQGFLFTGATGPIAFRYSANVQNVMNFDPLFSEALACRVAIELCETLTQSPAKAQMVKSLYDEAIAKAMRVNAIEAGSTEPDIAQVDNQRGPTREKLPPQQPPRQQQQ